MCMGGDAVHVLSVMDLIHAFMGGNKVDARIAGDPSCVFIIAFGVTVGIVWVLKFVSMAYTTVVGVAVKSVVDHRYACTVDNGAIATIVVAHRYAHMVGRGIAA